jgi:hypothetical protein
MFLRGNASGHDIQFHLSSWMEVANQLRHGILLPRWAEWGNWGFGEPRFIFYPPASWMLGAVLGLVLPWNMVPGAFIWIALVVAGMCMWTLAREWLPGPAAVAASVLFAADPYHLVMVYYRSDFAELLGAALLPLLVWAALHVARGERAYVPALAVAFASEWLCNAPVGVIATYALAPILIVACTLQRNAKPLLAGAIGMVLGFALAAFYILPAAYEQRWVEISTAISDSLAPYRNFLFATNNDVGFVEFNTRVSRAALAMIVVSIVAAIWTVRRRSIREPWWTLTALGAFSILLMTPPSLFLWRLLPKLWFIQFPWRWLDVLAVSLAFFVAAIAGGFRSPVPFWLVTLLALAGIATAADLIVNDTWWDRNDASYIQRGIDQRHGYDPAEEYAPLDTSPWNLPGEPATDDKDAPPPPETPRVEMISKNGEVVAFNDAAVRVSYQDWSAGHRAFTVESAAPTLLSLRLLNYPAWQVRVDGQIVQPGHQPVTGQMILPIATGRHRVEISFRRTWDRSIGGALSICTLLLLLILVRPSELQPPTMRR